MWSYNGLTTCLTEARKKYKYRNTGTCYSAFLVTQHSRSDRACFVLNGIAHFNRTFHTRKDGRLGEPRLAMSRVAYRDRTPHLCIMSPLVQRANHNIIVPWSCSTYSSWQQCPFHLFINIETMTIVISFKRKVKVLASVALNWLTQWLWLKSVWFELPTAL